MKVDAWTHILSPCYTVRLESAGGNGPGPFLLAQRTLHDMDARLRAMDGYGDYRQILAPIPFPHVAPGLAGPALAELVRRNNDEVAEMVRTHPDRFAGFAAATALSDPDAATAEAERSVRELGALGVQLEADAANLPIHEDRYAPLFAAMERLGAAVWLHPYRSPAVAGSPRETAAFLLWQVFGWTVDTTITVSQLVFAGIYDRHPRLKLIAHHGGGLIPHFSGRVRIMPSFTGMDAGLEETLAGLARTPLEYFRMLYVDSAMFGAPHGVRCVLDFFGTERVLFATDTPFDTRGGRDFIPATIRDIEAAVADDTARAAVFHGNAERVLARRLTCRAHTRSARA
jgi:aminocarboxymuconate-semialdehyde decarboxylase